MMQSHSPAHTLGSAPPQSAAGKEILRRKAPALLMLLLGALLLYGVGFAQPQGVHDAAHDTRHSLNIPCH